MTPSTLLPGLFDLPKDASTDGYRVDETLRSTGIVLLVCLGVLTLWMLWTTLAQRRANPREEDRGRAARAPQAAQGALLTLMAAALLFVALDGRLFFRALSDVDAVYWNFAGIERDPSAVRIEVNAHQWAWDVRYPGPDGRFNTEDDLVLLNDIRVPVGSPVLVELASTDVVHSFYLPNFRIKSDAVPGSVNRLWFRPKDTGVFEVACAQHCGVNHYKMRAELAVLSPDDYQRWYQGACARAARAYDAQDAEAHWGWEWKTAH